MMIQKFGNNVLSMLEWEVIELTILFLLPINQLTLSDLSRQMLETSKNTNPDQRFSRISINNLCKVSV